MTLVEQLAAFRGALLLRQTVSAHQQIDRFLTNNQLPKNLEERRGDFYAITAERRLRNLWSSPSPGTPMRRSFRIRSMILVPH